MNKGSNTREYNFRKGGLLIYEKTSSNIIIDSNIGK